VRGGQHFILIDLRLFLTVVLSYFFAQGLDGDVSKG